MREDCSDVSLLCGNTSGQQAGDTGSSTAQCRTQRAPLPNVIYALHEIKYSDNVSIFSAQLIDGRAAQRLHKSASVCDTTLERIRKGLRPTWLDMIETLGKRQLCAFI